jgi:hypothetical protein
MVLSDRYAGKPRPTLLRRTLIYVLSFGLGALLLVGVLGFTMVSIAEGLLPKTPERPAAAADSAEADGALPPFLPKRTTSKARAPRANEASGEDADDSKTPL